MEALLYNADDGTIERLAVTSFEFARDCCRALIKMQGDIYRCRIVDPLSGDKPLWDSYRDVIEARA